MDCNFPSDFRSFLKSHNIDFSETYLQFHISNPTITISLVLLNDMQDKQEEKANITLYEDEWYTKFTLVSNRLLANLGKQKSIFARNCTVQKISIEKAKLFLEANHILGYTKCKFMFGLFTTKDSADIGKGTIVAVAAFSAPRPMEREGVQVQSYEWVRYASLTNYRVVGGMGKLMQYFVKEYAPQEIMSYADKDWSYGDVYGKLGFLLLGNTVPIDFCVNKATLERVSIKKLQRECNSSTLEQNKNDYIILRNQGNLKFLWSAPFSQ